MAGELSNYGESGLFAHLLKGTAFPFAAQVRYFGISAGDPTDDGSGNSEAHGGAYARKAITGAQWDAASGRQSINNVDVTFDQITVQITGATHWTFWDASSGGNYLGKAAIPGAPVNFEVGSTPIIESGTFVIAFNSGGLSTYAANLLLDHYVVKTEFTQLANLYAFLSEGNPGDDFSGVTEPVGNGYARVVANTWTESPQATFSNTSQLNFPKATGDWRLGNNLAYCGLYDALTVGNGLCYGALGTAQAINTNERPYFAAGGFAMTID